MPEGVSVWWMAACIPFHRMPFLTVSLHGLTFEVSQCDIPFPQQAFCVDLSSTFEAQFFLSLPPTPLPPLFFSRSPLYDFHNNKKTKSEICFHVIFYLLYHHTSLYYINAVLTTPPPPPSPTLSSCNPAPISCFVYLFDLPLSPLPPPQLASFLDASLFPPNRVKEKSNFLTELSTKGRQKVGIQSHIFDC